MLQSAIWPWLYSKVFMYNPGSQQRAHQNSFTYFFTYTSSQKGVKLKVGVICQFAFFLHRGIGHTQFYKISLEPGAPTYIGNANLIANWCFKCGRKEFQGWSKNEKQRLCLHSRNRTARPVTWQPFGGATFRYRWHSENRYLLVNFLGFVFSQ